MLTELKTVFLITMCGVVISQEVDVSTQRHHIMDMLQNTEGQLQKKLVDPILELTEGL